MRSPTNRTMKRAGLALLSVVALVGGNTVAWGHGAIAGGGDRVHTCMRGSAPRTLRVVTPGQTCTGSEQGVDLPHNGTFIGVDIGPAVAVSLPAAAVAGESTGVINLACTPDPAPPDPPIHRAIGATVSGPSAFALTVSRLASPTTWEVSLAAITAGAKSATVAPICMRLFQQN
jgi:hypothetical protein